MHMVHSVIYLPERPTEKTINDNFKTDTTPVGNLQSGRKEVDVFGAACRSEMPGILHPIEA